MELETTGWPELPHVGTKITYHEGCIHYGVCKIVRADHVPNAAGKPGGKVYIEDE
ncbi:MAG: hypothetical protein ACRC2T_18920 [Thermoguttaceae bacterium]